MWSTKKGKFWKKDLPKQSNNFLKEISNTETTALHEAAYRQHVELVRLLVEKGAKVNEKNNIAYAPFRYAAMDYFSKEDAEGIILFLIAKGAKINEKDGKGETVLHGIALNGKINLLRILVEKGAEVNAADHERITALHLSSGNGQTECVQFLIERGANITVKAKNGMTAMDMALKNSHEETAEILSEAMKQR
jgi:ankyrin repeat protein